MKKKLALLLVLTMVFAFGLTACGGGEEEPANEPAETEVSKDTAILVVSFGTSFDDSRDVTIGAIEEDIQKAFPQYEVRRAFTAQIIIDKVKEESDEAIDNVTEALDRAVADGIKNLIVQPTHLMNGLEYNDLVAELEEYKDSFEKISVGDPLLTSDDDFDKVIAAITEATKEQSNDETAIVYMGHGTEADSNKVYADMQTKLADAGYGNYYIGTVEASPSLDDVVKALKENGKYKKVVLSPLMVVCGDHANNDMAGDEEGTWKTVLSGEGYEVETLMQGLGQIQAIRDIYVAHTQAAVDALNQ